MPNIQKEIGRIENSPSEQINIYFKTKRESRLNEIYSEIAKRAQIKSKSKWIEEGEKIQNIFLD